MTARTSSPLLVYGLATLIGVAAILATITPEAALGGGPGWQSPTPDVAQAITGHLAFQADSWRWPLLDARTLFWPRGVSVALTDSNPLVSLIAKVRASIAGGAPIDLLAPFWTLCWLLQPITAVYAARGLGLRTGPAIAAAVLAAFWPAQLSRVGHLNLCAHFELLLALGLVFRHRDRPMGLAAPLALLLLAVMTQPYLYALTAAVLAIVPLHAALVRRPGWLREWALFALAAAAPLAVLTLLSGPLGGGDKGFVVLSMNLLSPIWPQHSGVFGRDLPVIDATGGQYEGFNWIGAGTLLLLVAAAIGAGVGRRPAWPVRYPALVIVMAGLTLLSLSSRIYAGHRLLLDLGAKPWEDIFAAFRAPGRAFWPVGYAIMLFSVAGVMRLPRSAAVPLLIAAMALQIADTAPFRADVQALLDSGTPQQVPAIPAAATLVSVAPYPGCDTPYGLRAPAETLLLHAAARGARLGEIGLGRTPAWFSCEMVRADALELPLQRGELRAFFGTDIATQLRPALLGRDATCAAADHVTLCGRDIGVMPGKPVSAADKLPCTCIGTAVTGGALAPLLGTGWVQADGEIWSEGPFNTLLIALPREGPVAVTLRLGAIAAAAGGRRRVEVSAGRQHAATLELHDGTVTDSTIVIPAAAAPDGILRLAFRTIRPVDPARRKLAAPVSRAALRLVSLTIRTP
ncbi:MAG TPA: DUF6311 domain-containing protein [Acetobacteraceae bacterium]|jgi:hypothetical protein|nr:DUF6311 domain-containing protein [Acetobacteraceae bacterium]